MFCFCSNQSNGLINNLMFYFLLPAMYITGRSPKKSKIDRWLMCWWAFTGLTHMILEGYFAFSPEFYKDKTACYLAEVCKFCFSFSLHLYTISICCKLGGLYIVVILIDENWQGKSTAKVIQDMQLGMQALLLLKD